MAPELLVRCPECEERIRARAPSGVRKIKCPVCGGAVALPATAQGDSAATRLDGPSLDRDLETASYAGRRAKFAIISLVCGIAAIAYPAFVLFGLGGGLAAIFFGALGLKSEKRGLATSGMVLGTLAIIAFAGSTYLEWQTQRSVEKALDGMYERTNPN